MKREYIIQACSGKRIDVNQGQTITVMDVEGGQVVDFFAEAAGNADEFLSTGVTIDVGEHDLIHPCCRPEMYDFFYHNGEGHPNCLDNINRALGEHRTIITPVNLFMYTRINADGSISVERPISKANDRIVLKALMDITLGVAACSVSESKCNSGKCSAVKIIVDVNERLDQYLGMLK